MSRYAFLFPGQGSQKVGMGQSLCEGWSQARAVFEEADEALGMSLSQMCFEGPEDALRLTANTQPAILTTSVAALAVLRAERPDIAPIAALGHSLGEFSALVSAGALRFADAVRLVRLRGQAMQEAVPVGQGAMAAVIGVEEAELETMCVASAQGQVLSIANENGGGQIVVAGHAEAVGRLVDAVKATKRRALPLPVSAPFHCSLMQPAADRLARALADVDVGEMHIPVIANVDAEPNRDPGAVKALLVAQVTGRVRWERSVRRVARMGADVGLELGHGKVLAGLVRRIERELRVLAVGSPADIDVLKEDRDGAS